MGLPQTAPLPYFRPAPPRAPTIKDPPTYPSNVMRTLLTLLLAFALGTAAPAQTLPEVPPADPIVAFEHVHVLPMDAERVLDDYTVVVRDGRIVEMGPSRTITPPEGALRIDGTGKYLMPGLAEMHGHVPPPSDPAAFISDVLFLYVANGVTTVRGMLGYEGQLALRDQANRGAIISPTLYLAGPSFSGQSINAPEQAIERVQQQVEEGWDLLKVHPGLTREEYDAMATTAHALGIRFGGHVPADVGLEHALEMGQETFDHVDGYVELLGGDAADAERLAAIVEKTREAGAWVVPTMALWETLMGALALDELTAYEELRYMPPQMVASWTQLHEARLNSANFDRQATQRLIGARMAVLRALHEGGARLLMGTDAPQQFSVPGFSLHRELERMEAAGMTPYEVLRTGTFNVGQYFRNEDHFGTVTPGMRADLLLLDANPLEDLDHLTERSGVMVRGRWLPEAEIQARLERIATSY